MTPLERYEQLIEEGFPKSDVLDYLGMQNTFTLEGLTAAAITSIVGKMIGLQLQYDRLVAQMEGGYGTIEESNPGTAEPSDDITAQPDKPVTTVSEAEIRAARAAKAAQALQLERYEYAFSEYERLKQEEAAATAAREAAEYEGYEEEIARARQAEQAAIEARQAAEVEAQARWSAYVTNYRNQVVSDALVEADKFLSAKYGSPVKITPTQAQRLGLMWNNDLTTASDVQEWVQDYYEMQREFVEDPFNLAKSAQTTASSDVTTALGELTTAQTNYDAQLQTLKNTLLTDPLSSDITQMQTDLDTLKSTLNDKASTLSSKLSALTDADTRVSSSLKTLNETMGLLDADWTTATASTGLPANATSAKTTALTSVEEGTTYLNSFPSVLKANQTAALDAFGDTLSTLNNAITVETDKLTALRTTLNTESAALSAANAMPETTTAEKLAKLQAFDTAKSNYNQALTALNNQINTANNAINARNTSTAYKTLETWRPSTTPGETAQLTSTLSEATTYQPTINTLLGNYETAVDAEMATLNGDAQALATQIQEQRGLLSTQQSELTQLENDIPTEGTARYNRQMRVRYAKAAVNARITQIESLTSQFNSAYQTASNTLGTLTSNLRGVGSTSTLNAPTEIASVDELRPLLGAPFQTSRFTAAGRGLIGNLKYVSNIARYSSEVMGFTYFAKALYSLKYPAGSFALPPVSDMPLTGDLLRSSIRAQSIARAAIPFVRVLGGLAAIAGVAADVFGIVMMIVDLINRQQTTNYFIDLYSGHGTSTITIDNSNAMFDPYLIGSYKDRNMLTGANYFWNWTASQYWPMWTQWFQSNLPANQAYYSGKIPAWLDKNRQDASMQPDFWDDSTALPFVTFTNTYDWLRQQVVAEMSATGASWADATTTVLNGFRNQLNGVKDGREMYVTRQPLGSNDTPTWTTMQVLTQSDTATLLVALKYHPEMLEGTDSNSMFLFNLPSVANNYDFSQSQQYTDLCNANPYYTSALQAYDQAQGETLATTQLTSYQSLMAQVPPGNPQVLQYLRAQLNSIAASSGITQYLSADEIASYTMGFTYTEEEANNLFSQVYNNSAYLAFQSAWNAGVNISIPYEDFVSNLRPPWFSMPSTGPWDAFYNVFTGSPVNTIQNLGTTLSLINAVGTVDYTRSWLGAQGYGFFDSKHNYESHTFTQDEITAIQTWVFKALPNMSLQLFPITSNDWMTNIFTTAGETANSPYTEAFLYAQLMMNTYQTEYTRMFVTNPEEAALQTVMSKLKQAQQSPDLRFTAVREYDPIVGNTVNAVGTMQANSHLLSFYQALYLQDNTRWQGTPTEVLNAIGINPNLTNGQLPDGEDVGSNVVNGGTVIQSEMEQYQQQLATETTQLAAIKAGTATPALTPPADGAPAPPADGAPAPPADGT